MSSYYSLLWYRILHRDADMHLLLRPLHYSCIIWDLVHDASLAITIGILLGVQLVHETWLLVGGSRVVVT
jgi:hypothetical protein